jgi:hypothetical protein
MVRNLKDEIRSMQNIIAKYMLLSESFAEGKIHAIRHAIQSLIHQCVQSTNYTEDMGIILGIEANARFNSNTFFDFGYSPL